MLVFNEIKFGEKLKIEVIHEANLSSSELQILEVYKRM